MGKKILIMICIIIIFCIFLSISFYVMNQSSQRNITNTNIPDVLSSDYLLNVAKLGGDYLINATNDDGSFVYKYDALSDLESSSYNMLRHAGTVYSMLQLYHVTKNKLLLSASERAIDYLLSFKKTYDNVSCIVYDDEIKLGGNALAVIALAEYSKVTGDNDYILAMQDLTKYITLSQKDTGEFICKRYYSTGEISDFISEYYPGEALLALCRLYSLDNNESWLDMAEKGAQYLIKVRDAGISTNNLVHDHWLLMSLNELYRYRNNSLYFNHSMRIAESIMNKQRDGVNRVSEYSEWIGSYYTPPRSTSTATRSEGLIAACHLTNDFGDNDTSSRILRAIKLGIKFQLQTQFRLENVISLPNPQRAIGGFHGSLTDYDIRIDYVQHNICSIIGLYRIISE